MPKYRLELFPMNAPRSIEVHIEELVLHGFEPHQRHTIGDALQRELARLFSQPQLQPPLSRERIDAGNIRLTPSARPAAIGAQVASAVFGGIRQ